MILFHVVNTKIAREDASWIGYALVGNTGGDHRHFCFDLIFLQASLDSFEWFQKRSLPTPPNEKGNPDPRKCGGFLFTLQ